MFKIYVFFSDLIFNYKLIKSQKGNNLMLTEDGYTYSRIRDKYWVCSIYTRSGCKSKIRFNKEGHPYLTLKHIHPPTKIYRNN